MRKWYSRRKKNLTSWFGWWLIKAEIIQHDFSYIPSHHIQTLLLSQLVMLLLQAVCGGENVALLFITAQSTSTYIGQRNQNMACTNISFANMATTACEGIYKNRCISYQKLIHSGNICHKSIYSVLTSKLNFWNFCCEICGGGSGLKRWWYDEVAWKELDIPPNPE